MELAQRSDAEIWAVANPIMDRLMAASTAIDYDTHIQDFSDRLKSVLPRERFVAICQDYQRSKGFFAEREQIAIFRRPDAVALVWKQAFTRQPGEFVAEMLLIQRDDRYWVEHVMVF